MKNKIKIGIIGLALFAGMFITGCASQTGSTAIQINPQSTASVIHAIVPPAVRLAVAKQPESAKWILDAQVVICSLSSSTNVSPASLKAAVASTGIKEIQTPEIEATIESIYGLYSAYYADVVAQKLNANQWCGPVLQAICESLTQGLNPPTP